MFSFTFWVQIWKPPISNMSVSETRSIDVGFDVDLQCNFSGRILWSFSLRENHGLFAQIFLWMIPSEAKPCCSSTGGASSSIPGFGAEVLVVLHWQTLWSSWLDAKSLKKIQVLVANSCHVWLPEANPWKKNVSFSPSNFHSTTLPRVGDKQLKQWGVP